MAVIRVLRSPAWVVAAALFEGVGGGRFGGCCCAVPLGVGGTLFAIPGGIDPLPEAVGSFDVMARQGRAVCVNVQ